MQLTENAGVAIVVKNNLPTSIKDFKQVDGRIVSVTFASHGYDMTFICAYAPHSGLSTDAKEEFYDQLSQEVALCKGRYFIGGDFNARIHYVREGDTDVCGPHI